MLRKSDDSFTARFSLILYNYFVKELLKACVFIILITHNYFLKMYTRNKNLELYVRHKNHDFFRAIQIFNCIELLIFECHYVSLSKFRARSLSNRSTYL